MSTTSDPPSMSALPVAAVAAGPPPGPPSPNAQYAKADVHAEWSVTTPIMAGIPTPAASGGGVTAAGLGTYPQPVPPLPEEDVRRGPSTRSSFKGSSAIVMSSPTAAPGTQATNAAQADISAPKYLDSEWVKTGVPDTKFYKDYPPDPWGQEAAPNARVWKIYRDEMTRTDTETLDSWNGTLDVLLIFAGLFSAVSTAFVIESYKSLQPDYAQYMANFLYEAAGTNLVRDGVFMLPTARSMGRPDRFVNPSSAQRWTNGLWFTSLVISLTVALLCIMVKQWLDQYRALTKRSVPSLEVWACRHQIYYAGLDKWGVPTLISLLPLFLHVSLLLFFAGLVLFLRPLDSAIAFTLLAILILTLLFYLLSLVVPAFYIDCPAYTPLLAQGRSLVTLGLRMLKYLTSSLVFHLPKGHTAQRIVGAISCADDLLEGLRYRSKQHFACETTTIEAQKFSLNGQALSALLVSTNDPDVIDAGVEAIGALTAETTLEILEREGPPDVIYERLQEFLATGDTPSAFAVLTDARRLRTYCTLSTTHGLLQYRDRKIADFGRFLGLDGVMLQAMVYSPASAVSCAPLWRAERRLYHELLVYVTYRMDNQADAHSPHRQLSPGLTSGTCLLFLRFMRSFSALLGRHTVPCRLLAFCAGDFAEAEPHERASAIQHLLAFLEGAYDVEASTGNAPARNADDAARDALGCLFDFIATHHELLADDNVARPFIHHLGLVSLSLCRSRRLWPREQFAGFAAFTQLPSFAKNISSVGLDAFIDVLRRAATPSDEDAEQSQQYYYCVVMLLKLECDLRGSPDDILCLRIDRFFARGRRVITAFGRASNSVLLRFLRTAAALETRVETAAEGISCLLCHRLRIQPLADELVQILFTGNFLTNQFRELLASTQYDPGLVYVRPRIMTLAKHCARLSEFSSDFNSATETSALLRVCNELKGPRNTEDALEEDGLALLGDICRGLEPGGELHGECDPSCDCWYQPAVQPPAQPTSRITRWRNNIRRRISAAHESSVELADLAAVA